jgi:hypothetical protein
MFRRTIVLLSAMALGGCASGHGMFSSSDTSAETNRAAVARPTSEELAAYAGHAKFPDTQAKTDLAVASIVSPDKTTIKIYNFSSNDLRNVDVWVNGSYVQHVSGISPQSSVLIHTAELYNGLGKSLAGQSEPISRVQVQTDEGLYTTWGPAAD